MRICMYIYIYIYIYMCVCVCLYMYTDYIVSCFAHAALRRISACFILSKNVIFCYLLYTSFILLHQATPRALSPRSPPPGIVNLLQLRLRQRAPLPWKSRVNIQSPVCWPGLRTQGSLQWLLQELLQFIITQECLPHHRTRGPAGQMPCE